MTVFGATRSARVAQTEADGNQSLLAANDDAAGRLEKFVQFVPVEFVAAWTVIIGLLSDPTDALVLGLLALMAVALVAVTLMSIDDRNKADAAKNANSQPVSKKRAALTCVFLVVLLVVWALATAGSPLDQTARIILTCIAIIVGLVTPGIAKRLGLAPAS